MRTLLLLATIFVPALAGAFTRGAHAAVVARRRALIGAIATLLLAAASIAVGSRSPADALLPAPLPGHVRFGLDDEGSVLLGLVAAITALVLFGAPRAAIDARVGGAALLLEAAGATLASTHDLAVLTAAWCAMAVIPWAVAAAPGARVRRTLAIHLGGGALPLVAAAIVLGVLGHNAGLAAPFDLREIAARGVALPSQALLFPLVALAIAVRMAIVPFHSWLPTTLERGPLPFVTLLVGPQLGAFLAARLLPIFATSSSQRDLRVLAVAGVVTVVYGAVLAVAQRNARRAIGFLLMSQSGLLLVGITSADHLARVGVAVQSATLSLGTAALLLVLASLEARVGSAELGRVAGVVRRAPRMTAAFFLAAAAFAGLPGTLGFVGEDLLLAGVLHSSMVVAVAILVATALNGFTVLRAAALLFLGRPAGGAATAADLVPRERAAVLLLVAAVFAFGLAPRPLLSAQGEAAGPVHAAPHTR